MISIFSGIICNFLFIYLFCWSFSLVNYFANWLSIWKLCTQTVLRPTLTNCLFLLELGTWVSSATFTFRILFINCIRTLTDNINRNCLALIKFQENIKERNVKFHDKHFSNSHATKKISKSDITPVVSLTLSVVSSFSKCTASWGH